jgi:hypothetical protein
MKILSELILFAGIMINTGCSGDNPIRQNQEINEKPEVPHINCIQISDIQPQETDNSVIWFDDFDEVKEYLESKGDIDFTEFFGATGGSMKAGFKRGEVDGEGNRKIAFGDFPGGEPVVQKGRKFEEVYWRIYVKHEYGWEGSPAKMSRATSIVSANWQQAMIAHVWSGENNTLTLDPASGVEGFTDSIKTTGYNDFDHLSWLGNKPTSQFAISSTEESGYWVLVEASARLNTRGKSDGSSRLWIDGRLEAERTNLNFRGSYTKHGINAVFLESYWNNGSVKTQQRWYENFVVSTNPIGPVVCPPNPVLFKTPYHGQGNMEAWEIELAIDYDGEDVVFKSDLLKDENKTIVNDNTGDFTGSLKDSTGLTVEHTYFCRIRQKSDNGQWSDWSRWHQPFKVVAD